ncbi:MAG TPA: hypothetical protein VKF63_00305 [Terracidiphilus sp.]|nr:hypothetical protein [Terracidiphilus sp.]
MNIANKQSLAMARFQAFRTSPPSSWDESAVSQFNEVVSALGEAFETDLSSFRIPESELKQYEDESGSTSWVDAGRFPARKQMSDKRYCDEKLAQRKIDGIVFFFQNLQPMAERPKIGF